MGNSPRSSEGSYIIYHDLPRRADPAEAHDDWNGDENYIRDEDKAEYEAMTTLSDISEPGEFRFDPPGALHQDILMDDIKVCVCPIHALPHTFPERTRCNAGFKVFGPPTT